MKSYHEMTREELWEEFENQLIRETRTSMTMNFDTAERMTKLGIKETVAKWKDRLEQEPCEDCVSRKAVIKAVDSHTFDTNNGLCLDDDISCILEDLSPVTPTRKKGKWIDGSPTCPCCGEDKFKDLDADIWSDWQPKYCPNCGAEMEGEE